MSYAPRWIASTSASALAAAAALLAGRTPVERKLTAAIEEETAALADDLAAVGMQPTRFFEHAVPLSVHFDNPLELARVTLRKTLGPHDDREVERLGSRFRALFAAADRALPELLHELELRGGPLCEQWEARGAGLLAAVRRSTEPDVVVPAAEVILVQVVLGGAGAAYPPYNALHMEAVLTNPHAQLPEVARLGWLWSQLSFDLPKYADAIGRDRLADIGPLALIPPLLAAAQEVELARCDLATLELALAAWGPAAVEPQLLWSWWETLQTSSSGWPVALAALDQMLSAH